MDNILDLTKKIFNNIYIINNNLFKTQENNHPVAWIVGEACYLSGIHPTEGTSLKIVKIECQAIKNCI